MILDSTYDNTYLDAVRNGTLKQGLEIGCALDEHLVFKHGTFNVMIGQANVGKTDFIIWYLTALTIKHNLCWLIFSSENRIGGLKQKIIQYWTGKDLKDLSRQEYENARNEMNMFFKFIDTNYLYSARDLIEVFEENKQYFDGAIIDPYNSLTKDLSGTNSHEYDYQIASEKGNIAITSGFMLLFVTLIKHSLIFWYKILLVLNVMRMINRYFICLAVQT